MKWTAERRFVPVHLTSGDHASSFSNTQQTETTNASFASDHFVKSAVSMGNDPPPTASLRFPRGNAGEQHVGDQSLNGIERSSPQPGFRVIVFGMPPSHQEQLMEHFKQFGEFTVSNNHSIEAGRNYLCLSYTTKAAAQRALRENGKLGPGGYMMGCVSDMKDGEEDTGAEGTKIVVQSGESLFKRSSPEQREKQEGVLERIIGGLSSAIFGSDVL